MPCSAWADRFRFFVEAVGLPGDIPSVGVVPLLIQVAATIGQSSNPSSFAEAYRDYAQRVARWAHSLGGASIDPEDVVQEVFLVVNRKLASFTGEGGFPTWLFEITRRVVANHRRRQGRGSWTREGDHDLESVPSQAPDAAAELDRQRMTALLYQALDDLPEKYRTVFVLYEIDELSSTAIAELCRLKPSTVRVQLVRARARFFRIYQKLLRKNAGRMTLTQIASREDYP
jgi:RNA polymerase sigma-70 factor (ECF subfamily)